MIHGKCGWLRAYSIEQKIDGVVGLSVDGAAQLGRRRFGGHPGCGGAQDDAAPAELACIGSSVVEKRQNLAPSELLHVLELAEKLILLGGPCRRLLGLPALERTVVGTKVDGLVHADGGGGGGVHRLGVVGDVVQLLGHALGRGLGRKVVLQRGHQCVVRRRGRGVAAHETGVDLRHILLGQGAGKRQRMRVRGPWRVIGGRGGCKRRR